jgi:DNA-binding LacI/PurR family transcriptional regulator
MEDKGITSRDLSRILGLSQSTVSRALGDSPRVSAAARARVRNAATRLGYQPNALARGLSTRQTNLVGVVLSDSPGPFVTEMVRYLSQALERHGRRILLLHASNIADADMALQTLIAFHVDGVLFVSSVRRSQLPQKCLAAGIPQVLIDRSYDKVSSPMVETDNIAGGRLVGELFTTGGHRDLAYVLEREDSLSSIARDQDFREALAGADVIQIRRVIGRYTHDDEYAAGKTLQQSGKPPTAVFCTSDTMALGSTCRASLNGARIGAA